MAKRKWNINLKRRTLVRLVSYGMGVMIIISGFAVMGFYQASVYNRYIHTNTQRSLAELVTSINAIDTALEKGLYATTPSMMSSLSTEIIRNSAVATNALSQLPFAFEGLENTAKFLNQVGDYSYSLNKKVVAGVSYTDEERSSLQQLSGTAKNLAIELNAIQDYINKNRINIEDIENAQAQMEQEDKTEAEESENYSFKNLENQFDDMPTLVYDGPFSEHIASREPVFLKNKPTVTQDEARQKAAQFLGLRPEILEFAGEKNSTVQLYSFGANVDGGELTVDVTKQGGHIYMVLNSREVGEPKLSPDECIKKAQELLGAAGYGNMEHSYYTVINNMVLINFAYVKNDVFIYADLIKVGLAQDTGKVVIFEAQGYTMNHIEDREIPEPKVTKEEAAEKVSKQLNQLSYQLVIIPSDGHNEVFCHEFRCQAEDGRNYIVCINAETGVEERILILLEDENGTLAL